MLKEGDKAPPFKLKDESGNVVSLEDYKDKTVVLYFYPKDDTPGCTKEACGFRDQLGKFKKNKTFVFGVSADSAESHRKFKEKFSLPFPLLSDPDRDVIKSYGVWKEKSLYGRTFMGISRTTFVIQKGKIKKIFPNVKVDGHIDQVLSAVSN